MTWVDDHMFAAGGDEIPETWDAFADQTGIQAILHLRATAPVRFKSQAPERLLWLSIEEEEQADLETRLLAARYLKDCVDQGLNVLLHASRGRHRVRWAYVAYRISSGASVRSVLRQAAQPPWMSPYRTDVDTWQQFSTLRKSGAFD